MSRYALAIFTSAFLLFGVQPLAGRYALPWYGGTPGVWTACMLFFQVALLGGYAYAHGLASRLAPRTQARVHLGLLAVAVAVLGVRTLWEGSPVAPGPGWRPVGTDLPVLRLLAMLAATIGLPFFVLSTTGPLLQSWFARVRPGRSPYPLYALSNVGSLLALLGYPFLVEPWVGRGAQAWGWGAGFVVFAVACAVCAVDVLRNGASIPGGGAPVGTEDVPRNGTSIPGGGAPVGTEDVPRNGTSIPGSGAPVGTAGHAASSLEAGLPGQGAGSPPSAAGPGPAAREDLVMGTPEAESRPDVRGTLTWLGLSACASVLLLATTNQLSQDVAAGPFLWVMPLALYLVTFILAFARESFYSRALCSVLLIGSGAGVAHVQTAGPHAPLALQLISYATALFAGCMVCHGELYRLRPAPRHLSAFYLWVSAGGVLGGLFVSVGATALFRTYWEYPLALGICCLVSLVGMARQPPEETRSLRMRRVLRGSMLLIVAGNLVFTVWREHGRALFSARNFFGVVRVMEQNERDPQEHFYSLRHGAITHGWQYVAPERRARPTTYFTRESGLGLAIAEQRRLREAVGLPPGLRVGVLGLGVGTSAALLEAEDSGRFYEINPAVISLARGEGGFFTYLGDTAAKVEVVEGDARISLERELERGEPQGFDVLVLDTFSSDAIPVHLLTQEAVALYRKHLAPHGVMALHISNVHLDLVPVTLTHARALGLHATFVFHETQGDALRSNWMLLSPDREFSWGPTFKGTVARVRRLGLRGEPDFTWTDEQSSLLRVLRRGGPAESVMDVAASSGPPGPVPVSQPAPE
ncbi:fused MFS/spermidine synthase [Myxococcus sp. RHSTA-1-4]|uniref:fused MFS/spermidine synthase n=1 Tax=Myxococcus sp. RHSTA-1-4 TaxID=2874601 RepID=UPI001CBFFECD|nr:fused MFS/spermidine synthase [Myxococcus sp. RHSTA-1-4]MBZ4416174.1 fused MFS/spermidine synthase [Myxococcus sp. RHSTA-1-4]